MERVIKINDKVSVEVKKVKGRTIVILDRNGERLVLANKVINEGFSCDVVYDDNYVVVYSKGSMMNQIPLIIECAYSIKNDAILNTKKNKKLAETFQKMLQIIDTEEDKVQVFKALVTRKREPYVTSEEMLQPIDPSKKNEVKNMAQEFRKNNLVRVRKKH